MQRQAELDRRHQDASHVHKQHEDAVVGEHNDKVLSHTKTSVQISKQVYQLRNRSAKCTLAMLGHC